MSDTIKYKVVFTMFDDNENGIGLYEAMLNNKERLEIMGKCIERVRKKNRLTQKQVADILEMPQQTYGSYETGRNAPSIETLVRLSFLYEINIEELVGKWEKVSPSYDGQKELGEILEREELQQQINDLELRLIELEEMNRP